MKNGQVPKKITLILDNDNYEFLNTIDSDEKYSKYVNECISLVRLISGNTDIRNSLISSLEEKTQEYITRGNIDMNAVKELANTCVFLQNNIQ